MNLPCIGEARPSAASCFRPPQACLLPTQGMSAASPAPRGSAASCPPARGPVFRHRGLYHGRPLFALRKGMFSHFSVHFPPFLPLRWNKVRVQPCSLRRFPAPHGCVPGSRARAGMVARAGTATPAAARPLPPLARPSAAPQGHFHLPLLVADTSPQASKQEIGNLRVFSVLFFIFPKMIL